jgi:hypothetical protein
LKDVLIAEGHDAEWCGDWQKDPGDSAVLAYAHEHRRILLTLDKDFGELAILKGYRMPASSASPACGCRNMPRPCWPSSSVMAMRWSRAH